jgi:hypothetical protein
METKQVSRGVTRYKPMHAIVTSKSDLYRDCNGESRVTPRDRRGGDIESVGEILPRVLCEIFETTQRREGGAV